MVLVTLYVSFARVLWLPLQLVRVLNPLALIVQAAAANLPVEPRCTPTALPCRLRSLPPRSRRRGWRPAFSPGTIWWAVPWAPAPSSMEPCPQGRRCFVINLMAQCWLRSWCAPLPPALAVLGMALCRARHAMRWPAKATAQARAHWHVPARLPPHLVALPALRCCRGRKSMRLSCPFHISCTPCSTIAAWCASQQPSSSAALALAPPAWPPAVVACGMCACGPSAATGCTALPAHRRLWGSHLIGMTGASPCRQHPATTPSFPR